MAADVVVPPAQKGVSSMFRFNGPALRVAVASSLIGFLALSCGSADAPCQGDECAEQSCGDRTCGPGECETCPTDCKPSECAACGDGVCTAGIETCKTCGSDCGDCSACGTSVLPPPQPVTVTPPDCEFLDSSYCLFPFPSDHFTVADPSTASGRRMKLPLHGMPRNATGKPVMMPDLDRADGFSVVQTAILRIPGVSLERSGAPLITGMHHSLELDSPIIVVDAETGEQQVVWAEYDATAKTRADQVIFIRPGGSYKPGRRYIIALRNLKDDYGGDLEAPDTFRVYRDCIDSDDAQIAARRPAMNDILDRLASFGVKRSELYLAWDFTVSSKDSLTKRLRHMHDETFAAYPGSETPPFEVESVETEGPWAGFLSRVVTGKFVVPNYLRASPLPIVGGQFVLGNDERPLRQWPDYTAKFTCIIPKSSVDEKLSPKPGRAAVYGHQVFQDQTRIFNASALKLAFEHNITMCATDLVGLSQGDFLSIAMLLVDPSFFASITDKTHQAALNVSMLHRLLTSPKGFMSHKAFRVGASLAPAYDTREVHFFGEEYGCTVGMMSMVVNPELHRVACGVNSPNFGMSAGRTAAFAPYFGYFELAYPNPSDRALLFTLVQIVWDRAEAVGYAQHIAKEPFFPDAPPNRILMYEAFGDHVAPNIGSEQFARMVDAKLYTPALKPGRSPDEIPLYGIEPMDKLPFDGPVGFVVWDDPLAQPPPPINKAPSEGADPHGLPGESAAVRRQVSAFLRNDGKIIDVCNGQPCVIE